VMIHSFLLITCRIPITYVRFHCYVSCMNLLTFTVIISPKSWPDTPSCGTPVELRAPHGVLHNIGDACRLNSTASVIPSACLLLDFITHTFAPVSITSLEPALTPLFVPVVTLFSSEPVLTAQPWRAVFLDPRLITLPVRGLPAVLAFLQSRARWPRPFQA
jgi:hypothetical protein